MMEPSARDEPAHQNDCESPWHLRPPARQLGVLVVLVRHGRLSARPGRPGAAGCQRHAGDDSRGRVDFGNRASRRRQEDDGPGVAAPAQRFQDQPRSSWTTRSLPPWCFSRCPGTFPTGPPDRGHVQFNALGSRFEAESAETLAFARVSVLAGLLQSRQVSSVELTRLYLERLRNLIRFCTAS